jgi:IPT/TIG domain-containing protein
MSTQITGTTTLNSSTEASQPPGEKPMRAIWIALISFYLVGLSFLTLYCLVKLWPHPTPSGAARAEATASRSPASSASPATASTSPLPDPEQISFFNGWLNPQIYAETRLLLLVIFAGGLGSLMHSLRSLYWYTGNRKMVWSWMAFYLLLPFTGAILAVIFYFVVRGGFFSPQASFQTTSPFGFAALSALVGLFSPQATLKLKEVAETIFTKPGSGADAKPQEAVSPTKETGVETAAPQIASVTPPSGPSNGATPVSIAGTGFVEGVTVKLGSAPAEVVSSSSTSIEVKTPASASGPGPVDVEVTNPNGKTATLPQGFTYD